MLRPRLLPLALSVFGWLLAAGLAGGFANTSEAADRDVPWLAEVQRATQTPDEFDVGTLRPLLVDSQDRPICDHDTWLKKRAGLRAAWLAFLGPMPAAPANIDVTILRDDSLPDCSRKRIRYECEPGLFVEAYLLRSTDPKFTGPRPGIVALHQTTKNTIDEIAGLSGPESLQLGLKLARRGFIVICPRCFLWQDAPSLNAAVDQFRRRHSQTLGMHKMLYDASRAVDILAAQSDVDAERLGAVGHSLGAKEVLYLAAFDERIRAAVASEGGLAFKSTNWDAPWYLGPKIREADFERNHHELLALVAPRAFLVLGGETGPGAADGDRSWPLVSAALPVYRLFDNPPRLGLLNHGRGHAIPPEAFDRLAEWLEVYTSTGRD
jgi:Dienelactone hydrolase family